MAEKNVNAAPVAFPKDDGPHFFPCGCCWWVSSISCSAEHGFGKDGPLTYAPEDASVFLAVVRRPTALAHYLVKKGDL